MRPAVCIDWAGKRHGFPVGAQNLGEKFVGVREGLRPRPLRASSRANGCIALHAYPIPTERILFGLTSTPCVAVNVAQVPFRPLLSSGMAKGLARTPDHSGASPEPVVGLEAKQLQLSNEAIRPNPRNERALWHLALWGRGDFYGFKSQAAGSSHRGR